MKAIRSFSTSFDTVRKIRFVRELARASRRCEELQRQLCRQRRQNRELQARLTAREEENGGAPEILSGTAAQRDSLRPDAVSLRTQLAGRTEESARTNWQYEELLARHAEDLSLIAARQKDMHAALMARGEKLASDLAAGLQALKEIQSALMSYCRREIDSALLQSMAYDGLRDYFATGSLPTVTPWKRGWPASPDFILWLVELIERNDYDLIIEFGSGVTTLYTARTLAARSRRKASSRHVRLVSFDHLEAYRKKTCDMLAQGGCDEILDNVTVIHAPLRPYTTPEGATYQHYACEEHLSALSAAYHSPECRILVTVDGPPGTTCKNARFPAFPQVMRYFASAHVDFLLDDYGREDEREIAEQWQTACIQARLRFSAAERACEKGAFLLSIAPCGKADRP